MEKDTFMSISIVVLMQWPALGPWDNVMREDRYEPRVLLMLESVKLSFDALLLGDFKQIRKVSGEARKNWGLVSEYFKLI